MNATSRLGVVVGIDGSPASDLALDWAIGEASCRRLPLHLVHARGLADWWLGARAPVPPEVVDLPDHLLEERVAHAERLAPDVEVTGLAAVGHAPETLLELSGDAVLVVLGAHDHSPNSSLWLGSVPAQVATHASCPVVVVRRGTPTSPSRPRVVVGVDGSASCADAIGYAFEHASARSLGLTAIYAWAEELVDGLALLAPPDRQQWAMAQERQAMVSEAMSGWHSKYPDVEVYEHILKADPVEALLDEADHAELLVVGSRGLGGFAGLLLGSVSRSVLKRAKCTVAVVRPYPPER